VLLRTSKQLCIKTVIFTFFFVISCVIIKTNITTFPVVSSIIFDVIVLFQLLLGNMYF
jgi:hypothetical protein